MSGDVFTEFVPQKKAFGGKAFEIQRNLLEEEESQMAGPDNVREEENKLRVLPQRNLRRQSLQPGGDEVSRRIRQPESPQNRLIVFDLTGAVS